jgi:intracellular multiplication protein IcmB
MSAPSFMSMLLGVLGSLSKKSLSSYCFLETSDGDDTLIASDGSLATVLRVDGTRQMMGDSELNSFVDYETTKLSSSLAQPGHAIQVWFCRDPDLSVQLMKNMLTTPRMVGQRLAMDLEDLFAERETHLAKFIVHEAFYIVLWTRVSVLSKLERERMKKSHEKIPAFWPKTLNSQDPFRMARQMVTRHKSFVSSFIEDLNAFGIRSSALKVTQALRAIKASIYPDMTGALWKPRLVGEQLTGRDGRPGASWTRRPELNQNDLSHLLWPRLSDQIFDRDGEVINQHMVRVGRFFFSGVDMSVGQQDLSPFNELLNKMRTDEFPWRVSFLIEGDGIAGFQVKSFLASIAAVTNAENKTIRSAIQGLNLFRQQGGVVPRMRVSFATWTPSHLFELAEERASRLQKAAESWGYCLVSPSAGDALAGTMSSALGLDIASTATPGILPLWDALYMLPWMRDASPFDSGAVLFRTMDGRPWPWQPGSSQQDAYIDIVYSPSGRGKSVLLNTTNLAFCLSPLTTSGAGGSKLPMVSIIDIGFASEGLISLIKESLPSSRRNEAAYHRLRMIREHAINAFDLQLGCRKPLPNEKAFLVNFVTLLGTDPSLKEPPEGLSDLADRAIDEVYASLSDHTRGGQPHYYVQGEDMFVDAAVLKHDIPFTRDTTWYGITDALFLKGALREAALAQRHAVPLVEDLIQAVNAPQVKDIYDGATTGAGGEKLTKAFQRVLSSAIRAYPIIGSATKFDLGEARVIALDLGEAAPSAGGGPAEKQTAIVYMLARYVLANKFYLTEDNLAEMPEAYREYHRVRIMRIRETPKKIVFDEFHRTEGSPMVRQQVKRDMREGRRWGIQIALASQRLSDFDNDMLGLATGYWTLGVNNDTDLREAQRMFSLSNTASQAIPRYLNGPTRLGAPFLAVLQMKDGRHEHLLYNTLGPIELWAFSTTIEDVALRTRLYKKLGATEARRRLAKRFPGGSAQTEIHRRIVELSESGQGMKVDAHDGVIAEFAAEILAMN